MFLHLTPLQIDMDHLILNLTEFEALKLAVVFLPLKLQVDFKKDLKKFSVLNFFHSCIWSKGGNILEVKNLENFDLVLVFHPFSIFIIF